MASMRLRNCALTQSSLKRFGAPIRRRRPVASNVAGVSGLIQAAYCCGGSSPRSCSRQACQNAAPRSVSGASSERSARICGVSSIIMSRRVRSGRRSCFEAGVAGSWDPRSGAGAHARRERPRRGRPPRGHRPRAGRPRRRRSCRPSYAARLVVRVRRTGGRSAPRSIVAVPEHGLFLVVDAAAASMSPNPPVHVCGTNGGPERRVRPRVRDRTAIASSDVGIRARRPSRRLRVRLPPEARVAASAAKANFKRSGPATQSYPQSAVGISPRPGAAAGAARAHGI